jgi:hypothetical protein
MLIQQNPIKRYWRAMWFKDDDDNTPQGKLARGCFYIFYWIIGTALLIFTAQGIEAWWKST